MANTPLNINRIIKVNVSVPAALSAGGAYDTNNNQPQPIPIRVTADNTIITADTVAMTTDK